MSNFQNTILSMSNFCVNMKSFEPFLGKLSPLSETAITCYLGMKITQTLQETRILAHIGPTCGFLFLQILQFLHWKTLVQVIIFWFLPFSQEIDRVPIVFHSRDTVELRE